MESGKIRDAQDEMSAHAERASDLVQDPKDLFGVLQDLIGNHEVDRFITESQAVPFDVELNDLNPTPLETLPVRVISSTPNSFGCGFTARTDSRSVPRPAPRSTAVPKGNAIPAKSAMRPRP